MKCFVSCVTYEPKLRPTMQCQVGLYFLSNSFLMYAAISFSMLYFSRAWRTEKASALPSVAEGVEETRGIGPLAARTRVAPIVRAGRGLVAPCDAVGGLPGRPNPRAHSPPGARTIVQEARIQARRKDSRAGDAFQLTCVAQSMASCCISSDMSAFLITALRSVILFVCFSCGFSSSLGVHDPKLVLGSLVQMRRKVAPCSPFPNPRLLVCTSGQPNVRVFSQIANRSVTLRECLATAFASA